MEEFRTAWNKLKKLCGDYAHGTFIVGLTNGTFIVGLTVVLAIWGANNDQSIVELGPVTMFLPSATVWAITGTPYGFLIGYLAFDILGNFWDPTVPETLLLLGTTCLATICGVAARVGKLSWRRIIRNWMNSLTEDNISAAELADTYQGPRTVLKIAAWGLFFTVMFGMSYISTQPKISSECRDATEAVYQYTGVELHPWWLPVAGNRPTQEGTKEFIVLLGAQLVEKDPEMGRLLEARETACRSEIAEQSSKSSPGK